MNVQLHGYLLWRGEVCARWQLPTVLDEALMGGLVALLCGHILQLTHNSIPLVQSQLWKM